MYASRFHQQDGATNDVILGVRSMANTGRRMIRSILASLSVQETIEGDE